MAKANPNILQCDECTNTFKSKDTFKDHVSRYHGKDENIEMLEKKVIELEQIVHTLKERENQWLQENKLVSPSDQINLKETSKPKLNESGEHYMDTDQIPSHLKSVSADHLPLLNGYRMYCEAMGNGACSTNCGSTHMFEDDSEEAMTKMKRKINFHMADHYNKVYSNSIGLPYIETVFGEPEKQLCTTPQELKEFLRSDRALKVYSNMQELQAMSNIFNLPINVFTYGTRMEGNVSQVAEWMEEICPMKEAANLNEYSEGHFPPLSLYHNGDHFNLLVADTVACWVGYRWQRWHRKHRWRVSGTQ